MIERDLIDPGDGDVGIGVGREQHLARLGVQAGHFREQLQARHARHPLVYQEERDLGVPGGEFPGGIEPFGRGPRLQDPIVGPVVLPEVPFDGAQDHGIVIDRENDRFGHAPP